MSVTWEDAKAMKAQVDRNRIFDHEAHKARVEMFASDPELAKEAMRLVQAARM